MYHPFVAKDTLWNIILSNKSVRNLLLVNKYCDPVPVWPVTNMTQNTRETLLQNVHAKGQFFDTPYNYMLSGIN